MTQTGQGRRGARARLTHSGYIAVEIRKDIVARRIHAGDRMTVAEIAERFDVSGAPVREALQQLAGEGYIDIIPNKGAVVRVFGPEELTQVLRVREALESYQAGRFAFVVTEPQLARLEELATEFSSAVADGINRKTAKLNEDFHLIINGHDGNEELLTILERHQGVARMMRADFGQSRERTVTAAEEHFKLIGALRAHDGRQAAEIASAHVAGTLEDILLCYAATQEGRTKGA